MGTTMILNSTPHSDMLDLSQNPEALLTEEDGTTFTLDGKILTLVSGEKTAYLSSQEDGSFDCLRDEVSLYALMNKQALVDLIRNKHYIIS